MHIGQEDLFLLLSDSEEMDCTIVMIESEDDHRYYKKRTPMATSTPMKKRKRSTKVIVEGWSVVRKLKRVKVCRGYTRGISKV